MKPYRDYQAGLLEALREPTEAAAYLTAALEEGDHNLFLQALRTVAHARGSSVEEIEATLAADASLTGLEEMLRRIGLRLTVQANDRQVA